MLIGAICMLFLGPLHAGEVSPVSNSDKYRWLEDSSPEQLEFIHTQNHQLEAALEASSNYHAVEDWLFKLFDIPTISKTLALSPTEKIELVELGLGKPSEVQLKHEFYSETLFSSFDIKKNGFETIVSMGLSPDGSFLDIELADDGSIDASQVRIYDLEHRKLLPQTLALAEQEVAWFSPTVLFYRAVDPKNVHGSLNKYDVVTGETSLVGAGRVAADAEKFLIYSLDSHYHWRRKSDGLEVVFDCRVANKTIAADAQNAYVLCDGPNEMGEVHRLNLATGVSDIWIASENARVFAAFADQGRIFLLRRWGAALTLSPYDETGKAQPEIAVPICCTVHGVKWHPQTNEIQLTLASAVLGAKDLTYNVTTASWYHDPGGVMMGNAGVTYKTEVQMVTSADGAQVPLRLTFRSDLRPDGQRPVLFRSYGGFDLPGYLDPRFDAPTLEFLRRGGILAGAGLRGGNEFGPKWHKAAMNHGKIKTYQDLAAAAERVIQLGWTNPSRIISAGASNGGLTVSATALLYPGLFGLILPIAGPVDLLGKDRMDARDEGWAGEYGRAENAEDLPYLRAVSPLENVAHIGTTRFLILEGLSDTRVNMTHSLKFAAALEDVRADGVYLNMLRNSGHFLISPTYQNLIAWRANTAQWTFIFDQAGWHWGDVIAPTPP